MMEVVLEVVSKAAESWEKTHGGHDMMEVVLEVVRKAVGVDQRCVRVTYLHTACIMSCAKWCLTLR